MVFTIDSTTDEVVAGLELTGKVAVITGASGGLGAETARAIASTGATVVLLARSVEKLEATRADIIKSTGNQAVHVQRVDLLGARPFELLKLVPAVGLRERRLGARRPLQERAQLEQLLRRRRVPVLMHRSHFCGGGKRYVRREASYSTPSIR